VRNGMRVGATFGTAQARTRAVAALEKGTIRVTKARVRGREKDRTKTRENRQIHLCSRALEVLKLQLSLRARLVRTGLIDHSFVFIQENGAPILNLSYPYDRWRYVLEKARLRYREPYNARHSYISWRLMLGDNVLLVAKEDGHSAQTMLSTYAAWTDGATSTDVEMIRNAMKHSPHARALPADDACARPPGSFGFATNLPPGELGGKSGEPHS
jgi:integrase